MRELGVGNNVFLLRFLPDSQRAVVGTADPAGNVTFFVLSVLDGERVPLDVPQAKLSSWIYQADYGNAVAFAPPGDVCYLAWDGTLRAFRTSDGQPLAVPDGVRAHQVVISPRGDRLLAMRRDYEHRQQLFVVAIGEQPGIVLWHKPLPLVQIAGFLPDGERFVTVDSAVRIRSFATGDEVAAGRTKPVGTKQPQISADGHTLGLIGYGNIYFWDLTTLAKPRKIGGTRAFGDFRSFAFHPNGNTVAVIHGGPTLVKEYDLASLERVRTWKWKLGPLNSVAFSPDGILGAAGSEDGRIVVWDVDG